MSQPEAQRYFKKRICELLASDLWQDDLLHLQEALFEQITPWLPYDMQDRIEDIGDVQQAIIDLNEFKSIRTRAISAYAQCD